MANNYNTLESSIVTALQADDYFKAAAGNIGAVEEKLSEDPASLYDHQLPYVGVFVYGGGEDEIIGSAAYYRQSVNVMFEVICSGGSASAKDTQLKRIMAELRRFIRDQNQLDTKFSDTSVRKVRNLGMDIAGEPSTPAGTAMNIYLGYTRAEIEIYET